MNVRISPENGRIGKKTAHTSRPDRALESRLSNASAHRPVAWLAPMRQPSDRAVRRGVAQATFQRAVWSAGMGSFFSDAAVLGADAHVHCARIVGARQTSDG